MKEIKLKKINIRKNKKHYTLLKLVLNSHIYIGSEIGGGPIGVLTPVGGAKLSNNI